MKIDSTGKLPTITKGPNAKNLLHATVFPNLSEGQLSIELNSNSPHTSIELIDISGNTVFRSGELTEGKHDFNLSHLPQGNYFYSVVREGKILTQGSWMKAR
ncbi:MAG: T9SS type A sorting domain-containing protein [Saprospiraceae bacterium]|nr:T9SS type A sorting domain-containing protein [Saprospiraceae bacterium]